MVACATTIVSSVVVINYYRYYGGRALPLPKHLYTAARLPIVIGVIYIRRGSPLSLGARKASPKAFQQQMIYNWTAGALRFSNSFVRRRQIRGFCASVRQQFTLAFLYNSFFNITVYKLFWFFMIYRLIGLNSEYLGWKLNFSSPHSWLFGGYLYCWNRCQRNQNTIIREEKGLNVHYKHK